MQHGRTLVAGLLFCGILLLHNCDADISLTLRNAGGGGRRGGQPYLPPPVQELPIDEAINRAITEEIVNIEGGGQGQFRESSYGNSRYHIFEVHNRYSPGGGGGGGAAAGGFKGPDYLPPVHGNAIESNAVAEQQGPAAGPLPTTNIPIPFPSNYQHDFPKKSQAALQAEADYDGPEFLTPQGSEELAGADGAGGFQGPDYLPPQGEAHGQALSAQSNYQGPDYLPPHQDSHQQHRAEQAGGFSGPDYLPPHAHSHGQSLGQSIGEQQSFQGPDYLPPHSHNEEVLSQPIPSQQSFQGPDYLPPHGQSHHEEALSQPNPSQQAFQGPDYLPPHSHHGEALSQPIATQQSFKGPDYLPPHSSRHEEALSQPIATPQSFQGPDYLPPHSHQEEVLSQPIPTQQSYQGPDYLPPQTHEEVHSQSIAPTSAAYRAPDYLPPQNGISHAPHQDGGAAPTQATSGYNTATYSSGGAGAQSHRQSSHSQAHDVPRPTQAAQNLPSGYDFIRPSNAEEAIAQLHSLQLQQQQQQGRTSSGGSEAHVVQAQLQVGGRELASDIVYGQPKLEARSNGGNAYLPPASASVAPTLATHQAHGGFTARGQSHGQHQQQQQQRYRLQSPHYGVQSQGAVAPTPYRAPAYLPPAAPSVATGAQQQPHLHSLSSYMTAVQPYARYGAAQYAEPRRPFAKYGPPPAAAQPAQPPPTPQTVDVAPMYREQASRSQYYAPAMTYAANAIAHGHATHTPPARPQPQQQTYSLSAQSKQALQSFMPKDVQRQIASSAVRNPIVFPSAVAAPPPVPAPAPTPTIATAAAVTSFSSGKIRTVQIINPHAVRTLKVLETSDHAGVKTIKILGTSNENPMGEHHIVKVVSESGHLGQENHVQTVKIYNDHKDVSLQSVAQQTAAGSGYLPPRSRLARKRSIRVARESVLRRHQSRHGSHARAKEAGVERQPHNHHHH